jgi:hypothetical protein
VNLEDSFLYSLSDKYFGRRREEVSVFIRKTETSNRFILVFQTIVFQINILVGVQTLVWFCQTKVWTPFSESLYIR